MPRKPSELTKRQQQTIRSNLARSASQIGNRLAQNALGKLETELTPGQIKSCEAVLRHVLPAMQSTEVMDITETVSRDEMQEQLEEYKRELIKSLSSDEIARLRDQ